MPNNSQPMRSDAVQEVMNKSPHLLVAWGNTFILTIVLALVAYFNSLSLPVYTRVAGVVAAPDPGRTLTLVTRAPPAALRIGQPVTLRFDPSDVPAIRGRIGAIERRDTQTVLLRIIPWGPGPIAADGLPAVAVVESGKRTILQSLTQRFQ